MSWIAMTFSITFDMKHKCDTDLKFLNIWQSSVGFLMSGCINAFLSMGSMYACLIWLYLDIGYIYLP